MRKAAVISLAVFLVLGIASCFNGTGKDFTETPSEPGTTSLDDISIIFPEVFIASDGLEGGDEGFQRSYRWCYYGLQGATGDLVFEYGKEFYDENFYGIIGTDFTSPEPTILTFIKEFDIPFEEFEYAAKKDYLFELENKYHWEPFEVQNPYLLYTFHLERIKDYYSLDPARNASAKKWLEEWLCTNEPYESYTAFRKANPQ